MQVARPRTKGSCVHPALEADRGGLDVTACAQNVPVLESWKLPHPLLQGCWECSTPGGAAPIFWVSPCRGTTLMLLSPPSTRLAMLSNNLTHWKKLPLLPSLTNQPHQVLASDPVPFADLQQVSGAGGALSPCAALQRPHPQTGGAVVPSWLAQSPDTTC